MKLCTKRSDELTNLRSAELDGSFNTASGSPNRGTDAKCIRDSFCQWSTATSATLD